VWTSWDTANVQSYSKTESIDTEAPQKCLKLEDILPVSWNTVCGEANCKALKALTKASETKSFQQILFQKTRPVNEYAECGE